VGAVTMTGGMTSSLAPAAEMRRDSTAGLNLDREAIERAVLDLEKTATDLYVLKSSQAAPLRQAAAKISVVSAMGLVSEKLEIARRAGFEDGIEQIRQRIELMVNSDLGKMGIDFMTCLSPNENLLTQAPVDPPTKKRRSPTPGM